ncbi:MAG TPA: tRNA (N6-isopentenyl adenosine(37)-C2)-methylthiotransferase MiaB [Candidatus Binataceae bacterium]|nr:tRNA (N6-isopentenyl adenosine(37)-C2)-methylthiotransferase MiaB [Candidatus Binataceae bacterium]
MEDSEQPRSASSQPRVFIETYGCQMNIADSELVGAVLRRAGYVFAAAAEEADVILLNTCAIREHAEARVLQRLGHLARLRRMRPGLRLGLLGCMATHNRAALIEKAPWLDLVAGPDSYRRLPELLGRARSGSATRHAAQIDVRLDRLETYADIVPAHEGGVRAYVTAMRGCDRFCAFCVVPYVRGRERSVPPEAILDDIRGLAARGAREIVLLGQTVNAYRFGDTDFGRLLHLVAAVEGVERIRFTSPHPSDMSESVIEAMAIESKVQPSLHLPVQSGSDRVLSAMERGYTAAEYLRLVERIRGAVPAIALSTDIIVGFHGEEEAEFRATLELMAAVRYDSAFSFKYSLRENTRAFRLGDTVSEEEKGRRLAEVIALQERISAERNRVLIGEQVAVLVEGPARRGQGMLAGKTPQFKTAVFPAAASIAPGDTVAARVESASAHTLHCVLA